MRRRGRPRTRSVAELGSPPQTKNKEEPLKETVGESVLHAHEPQPQPQQNPDIHQEPAARLTVDQFMDIFEGFVANVARREPGHLKKDCPNLMSSGSFMPSRDPRYP
ncbi:hypothetical protein WN943_000850 [Citrus x changshan-huyou]